MQETMKREQEEAIAMLMRANSALSRIFNTEEGEEWEERTGLTHAQQLDRYGWCVCEGTNGEGQMAEDCPKGEGEDE